MTSIPKSRVRLSALVAIIATVVLVGVALAGAAVGPDTEHITVTQEFQQVADDQECVSRADGMRMTRSNTADSFTIVVTVSEPLCQEVSASAVIYLIPVNGTGDLWPQTLSEKVALTFQDPSVTTVRWDKYCIPAQFDIITGATPPTIAPWGPWHGPLLFPPTDIDGNGGSSLQYLGAGDCTTTTTNSSIPEEITDTTTTVPAEVLESTTSVVGGSSTTVAGSAPGAATVGGTTGTRSGGAAVSVAG